MTRVVFETATIQDAIKKADRIAPKKGSAFDKASGILIEVSPAEMVPIVIRATDTQVFYREWVDAIEAVGDPCVWRVPSIMLATVISALPIGSGKTVTFEQEGNLLHVTAGRRKARMALMDPAYYPNWAVFDPESLVSVADLGGRISQVSWAAAKAGGEIQFTGVNITGEEMIATDRYRLAKVPCPVPVTAPITVPGEVFSSILKQTGETRMAVSGSQLWLMPDDTTQIISVIFDAEYPNVSKVMNRDRASHITLNKTQFADAIQAALGIVKQDRFPALFLNIGDEEVTLYLKDSERGDITDAIELPGQCVHETVTLIFTPRNILEAVLACPNEQITLGYDENKAYTILHVDGGSGYEAWVIPRKSAQGESQ